MNVGFLVSNALINVGVLSWVSAQLIKTILYFVKYKKFDKSRLSGSGGMPSSHSAVVSSVVLTAYLEYGFDSGIFAMAFILALIVMYDATGVRWAAGLHAKAINNIVKHLQEDKDPDFEKLQKLIPKLNESIGHRQIEVFCGMILGIVISILNHIIFR